MKAQELINQIEKEEETKEKLFNLFYPLLSSQIQADKNITKILKELR